MKFKNISIGQKVKTYCAGCEVEGVVIEKSESRKDFLVEHKPIEWGGEIYTKTRVSKSTPLQAQFYSESTPSCFINGDAISFES